MKRLIVILIALLLVGGAVYSLQFGRKGSRLERGVSRGIEVTPDYIHRYALRPDRRFELALVDVQTLIAGESATFETTRKDAIWSIKGPRGLVARFDNPPSYAELLTALKKHASSLGLRQSEVIAELPAARLEIQERSPFFPYNGSVLGDVNQSFSISSPTELIVASSAATM